MGFLVTSVPLVENEDLPVSLGLGKSGKYPESLQYPPRGLLRLEVIPLFTVSRGCRGGSSQISRMQMQVVAFVV